ncbi:hypothetical protein ACFOY2_41380 [Nonomuraea purpurea]|uniref:Uncharacterized protein n=1 Tax=Nonomuraea purpurea TaxID=1849276 RepID=A0ABV8GIS3_9ACTN
MAALTVLAVVAAMERRHHPAPVVPRTGQDAPPDDYGLIALTVPEIRRLLAVFNQVSAVVTPRMAALRRNFELRWSTGDAPTRPAPAGTTTANASPSHNPTSQHHALLAEPEGKITKHCCRTRPIPLACARATKAFTRPIPLMFARATNAPTRPFPESLNAIFHPP